MLNGDGDMTSMRTGTRQICTSSYPIKKVGGFPYPYLSIPSQCEDSQSK